MKKLMSTFGIVAVALSLGYFLGHEISHFRKNNSNNIDFSSSAPRTTFANLHLQALPTSSDQLKQLTNLDRANSFLRSYHERAQYKWNPNYSVFLPAFDNLNRPYFRFHNSAQTIPLSNGFQTLREGLWEHNPINAGVLTPLFSPNSQDFVRGSNQDILWDPKMAVFDSKDRMYTVLRLKTSVFKQDQSYVLLSSTDHGVNWKALPLTGTTTTTCNFRNYLKDACQFPELYDLERPYTSKPLTGPPAILYHVSYGKIPGYEKAPIWIGTVGSLYLQPITENTKGELHAEAPVLISESAQEIGYRSGAAPKIIHVGSKYFVTWLEANKSFMPQKDKADAPIIPAPDATDNPYSGVWVAEYDTKTKSLHKKEILKTWPINDSHNQPGIVRSSDGHLHVIAGGHGSHFTYTFTFEPDSIREWSLPVPVNTEDTGYNSRYSSPRWHGGGQTYISMMIDSKDVIHTAYRQWYHDAKIFDAEYFGALMFQNAEYSSKDKHTKWGPATVLVYPNGAEYTHWYQTMTLDRKDHIYLEYSNARPSGPYVVKGPDGSNTFVSPYSNNALLRSDDGGQTWFFPTDDDFKK